MCANKIMYLVAGLISPFGLAGIVIVGFSPFSCTNVPLRYVLRVIIHGTLRASDGSLVRFALKYCRRPSHRILSFGPSLFHPSSPLDTIIAIPVVASVVVLSPKSSYVASICCWCC